MKKQYFLIFGLIICQITASSQPCLPDGISFTTQSLIDNFQTNYPNCTVIEGDVSISGDDITNLNGLNVLTSIGGGLSIGDWYNSNLNLTSLAGLEGLTSIGDYLSIASISLTSLTGLDNVTSIGGSLNIGRGSPSNIPALTSLTGLEGLTSIAGYLEIGSINFLTNLTGLDNVTSIGEYLFLWDNDSLTSLTGLENLTSIGGRLLIGGDLAGGNNALTSLTGLDNVTSIGDGVYIGANDALITLTGLDNVTSIGGQLYIYSNDDLINLTSLYNIDAGSITDLDLFNNSSLAICEVQSICYYLASPNGSVSIHDNSPGCNSLEEVEAACGVGVEESLVVGRQSSVRISPNPFSTSVIIEYELARPGTVRISIYNQIGGLAYVLEKRQAQGLNQLVWAPKNLPNGIFYFRLRAGDQQASGKMMLMR